VTLGATPDAVSQAFGLRYHLAMNALSSAIIRRFSGKAVSPPAATLQPDSLQLECRGWLNEVSTVHVAGWIQNNLEPEMRVPYVVALGTEILTRGVADQWRHGAASQGIGDGAHAFLARIARPLNGDERAMLTVRPVMAGGTLGPALPRADIPTINFEPLLHVAMDIVDNCNLRCPFCLFDYANTRATHFMTDATFDAAVRLMPFTRDGEFWFSCLHEPTLHPQLTAFVDRVPLELRRKIFFTTNIAKRLPASFFEWLSGTALHHINISIESLRPELYERMRKGARHRIFMENWDAVLHAFARGVYPPRIRYIAMVYNSNVDELPELVRYLLEERRAWEVELRWTFDVPHLDPAFRAAEFLTPERWLRLRDELAHVPADRLKLLLPPPPDFVEAAPTESGVMADFYMLRMSWDGSVRVVGVDAGSRHDEAIERPMVETNVHDIADAAAFIDGLRAHAP